MITTGRAAAATAIFYPESDGMPLPDGLYQENLFTNAVSRLRAHFRDIENALVSGNTFIYYAEGDPRRNVAPDCYVSFNLSDAALESLSKERNNTYLLWEVGKPPDFVMEIGSPSTADRDMGFKRDLYARIGVPEYWRYDQTGGRFYRKPLAGERLVDGKYQRLEMRRESDGSVWGHSDALNLDLWWIDGELRFRDPVRGAWLRNLEESEEAVQAAEARASSERDARLAEAVRADAERDARLDADARADAEAVRADAERDARLASDARVAQLEAELRRLRGE